MTLTTEQTQLVVRTLAERVMRNDCILCFDGTYDIHGPDGCWKTFTPTTSRDDMAEVEARLTDAQKREYMWKITGEWKSWRDSNPVTFIPPMNIALDCSWFILTASPLVRAVCLCLSMGVKIG